MCSPRSIITIIMTMAITTTTTNIMNTITTNTITMNIPMRALRM